MSSGLPAAEAEAAKRAEGSSGGGGNNGGPNADSFEALAKKGLQQLLPVALVMLAAATLMGAGRQDAQVRAEFGCLPAVQQPLCGVQAGMFGACRDGRCCRKRAGSCSAGDSPVCPLQCALRGWPCLSLGSWHGPPKGWPAPCLAALLRLACLARGVSPAGLQPERLPQAEELPALHCPGRRRRCHSSGSRRICWPRAWWRSSR